MIGKVSVPRGKRVEPLIYYLYGPGRYQEHTDPHLIAGWRHPAELEPPLRSDGRRDFRHLFGLLNQPHDAMGSFALARPVWHCSLRAAPGDRMLSDDEWANVASDAMHRTGLSRHGEEDDGVRWVAVRHGADHIHVVAMLARQDFRRPQARNDFYRVREACRVAERRYGLRSTAPADRTAARRPSRAEAEKAARRGWGEPPRVTLRRLAATAAAASSSEEEFFARLDQAGVLVRKRVSVRRPGQVTGYAVAMPGDTASDGGPVWYGGGKLAPALTWPKLCQRWTLPRGTLGDERLTTAERNAAWEHTAQVAAGAAEQIRAQARSDPAAAADAAWAASDTLHVAAAMLGSKTLRQAADAYDRAARAAYGRLPPPTPMGNRLRQAARFLAAFAHVTGDPALGAIVLITRLAALADAVAELRDAQQHAVQAAAARAAAERLYASTHPAPRAQPRQTRRARTAAQLAALDFPPTAPGHQPSTAEHPNQGQGGPPPGRWPSPLRPRGPGR